MTFQNRICCALDFASWSEAEPFARKIAEAIGTEHREVLLTEGDFLGHLEGALDGLDQPTFDAINAETQLLFSSDWPHWDFDTPSTIYDLPFLNEKQKRSILGGNAARLFGLKDRYQAKAAAE